MTKNPWLAALAAAALLIINSGCEDECTDRFDCRNRGDNFTCQDGMCVEEEPQADAGDGEDAGQDAGGMDAGDMDAGDMDAGDMDGGMDGGADAGPECTALNPSCAGPFACDLATTNDAGMGVCRPLLIGVTQDVDAGLGVVVQRATLVPFNDDTMQQELGDATSSTRLPRFSGDGSAVAYVRGPAIGGVGPVELVHRSLTGTGGMETVLTNSTDAGTTDFVQLEYAPADKLLWTKVDAMGSRAGLQWIAATGGAVNNEDPQGGYGAWHPNATQFAFYNGGIQLGSTTGTDMTLTTNPEDVEPEVSRDGAWILYLRGNMAVDPLYAFDLYAISTGGGTPVLVEGHVAPMGSAADGGTPGSFIANATWGAGTTVVYVRYNYIRDAMDAPVLCDPTVPACGGRNGQQIVFRTLDATSGMPGAETVHGVGIHPAVSPDGAWLAYIAGGGTNLRVVPIDPSGAATDGGFTHTFPSLSTTGRDARPRWQPK